MGVCHFPSFYEAMDAAQHIVPLDPVAVELVDDTMINLAQKIDIFKPTVDAVVKVIQNLLLVEFAEENMDENHRRLKKLHQLIGDLGYSWNKGIEMRYG